MKWKCGLTGLLLGAVVMTQAWADGRSAAHNLFSNLARSRSSLGVTEANTLVAPSLVRGIYALTDQRGQLVGFTNESGTIFGDSRGFNVLAPNGAPPRPIGLDEVADLKSEVLEAIDFDKLPKVVHGDGGGRRILMFSAIDCGYCKGFEESMRRLSGEVNTTFYVLPASLQQIPNGGLPAWQTVSKIWCADDSGSAWLAFWASRAVPAPRQCLFADPRTAWAHTRHLLGILQGVGMHIQGSPQFLREDGVVIGIKPSMDASYVVSTFGPAGKPPPAIATRRSRWLTAAANSEFQAQPVGSAYGATPYPHTQHYQPPPPQKKSFNVNDAINLKKLFGK